MSLADPGLGIVVLSPEDAEAQAREDEGMRRRGLKETERVLEALRRQGFEPRGTTGNPLPAGCQPE